MHSYGLDGTARQTTYSIIGVLSFLISYRSATIPELFGVSGFIPFSLSFGVVFGVLIFIFDRYAWKLLTRIPNLNGDWEAVGISSYTMDESEAPNHEFSMNVKIKQTFSRIGISTTTGESTSNSTMASFQLNLPIPVIRYSFENIPMNRSSQELQRHPGMVELRIIDEKEMSGDYFSGKHRLRFGSLTLRR